MNYIQIEHIAGIGAVRIIISRERALNALNLDVLKELAAAFEQINQEETTSVMITGAGQKAFIAGADIKEMQEYTREEARRFAQVGVSLFGQIEQYPLPVIAAINGYALGGGLELALACDIRIASENAVFAMPELSLGIIPGFGGTQRLMRTVSVSMAKEMIYSGVRVDARKAMLTGLVNDVFPREELMTAAETIAGRIDRNSSHAIISVKQVMNQGLNLPLEEAIEIETDLFSYCFETEEQENRMAEFLKK